MRAVMILAGVALIQRFDWILYVFGAFLIVSGLRMAIAPHAPEPERNPVIALARRLFPVTTISPESALSCGSTANRLSHPSP
jgi:tellurite resistance protein TerC